MFIAGMAPPTCLNKLSSDILIKEGEYLFFDVYCQSFVLHFILTLVSVDPDLN